MLDRLCVGCCGFVTDGCYEMYKTKGATNVCSLARFSSSWPVKRGEAGQ